MEFINYQKWIHNEYEQELKVNIRDITKDGIFHIIQQIVDAKFVLN